MSKSMNEIFSHNLRNALYMAGKTQVELAKAVNVTETSVSHWINGTTVPRPNKLDQICKFLKCRKEDLLLDHSKSVMFAPVDILADEMTNRPELYSLFNAILKMNTQDLELLSNLVKRLSI